MSRSMAPERPDLAKVRERYAAHFPDCKIHPHNEVLALLDWAEAADKVIEAAREQHRAEDAMLSVVPIGAHGPGESALMMAWIDASGKLDDLLSPSGSPEPAKP